MTKYIIKEAVKFGNGSHITLPQEWLGKKVFVCLKKDLNNIFYQKLLNKGHKMFSLEEILSEKDYKKVISILKEESKKKPKSSIGGMYRSSLKDFTDYIENKDYIPLKDLENVIAILDSANENKLIEKITK